MDPMTMLLKPGPFKVKVRGDPEQLLQDFSEYMEVMNKFFIATAALGGHTEGHQDCDTCTRVKAMVTLKGGKEMDSLFRNVGKATKADNYKQAVQKVKEGITAQTNQSMAQYKLMRETQHKQENHLQIGGLK